MNDTSKVDTVAAAEMEQRLAAAFAGERLRMEAAGLTPLAANTDAAETVEAPAQIGRERNLTLETRITLLLSDALPKVALRDVLLASLRLSEMFLCDAKLAAAEGK